MRNSRTFRRIVVLTLIALAIAGHTAIFWHFWNDAYIGQMTRQFFFKGNMVLMFVYALLYIIFGNVYGAFRIRKLRFADLAFSQILALFFTNIIIYLQVSMLTLEIANPVPILQMSIDNVLCIVLWTWVSIGVYKWLYPPRDMLLVYSDHDPDNLVKKFQTREDKYRIKESIHCDTDWKELTYTIKHHQAVILCDIPSSHRNNILKYCYSIDKRVYVTPKLSDLILRGAEQNNMFDSPLLVSKIKGLKWEQAFVKRCIDIVVSLILCVPAVFMTILVLVGNIIFDHDFGPIFYTQIRLTQNRKEFKIIKFRSMKVDSEKAGARLAMKDDDRITTMGKVLRATHLDELPQVFNILIGQMSVVGPRPERPEIAKEYEDSIPEFAFRLKVKAGLTGYAQVFGKYNTTPYDKLKLDLYYIQQYKVWTDFQIILMTFKIMFIKENTEGVDKEQTTAMLEKKKEM